MDRTRLALEEMSREDPERAARLVLQTLPAAAARLDGVSYDLVVHGLGTWRMGANGANGSSADGDVDFELVTDAGGLAAMAAGASPVGLMLRRKLRIKGSRRRALRLRELAKGADPTIPEAL